MGSIPAVFDGNPELKTLHCPNSITSLFGKANKYIGEVESTHLVCAGSLLG
jgi:hypothetical protein